MSFKLTTDRLQLSELTNQDGSFILALFTDPDCLRFIGDRGIRNLATANQYLQERLINSYRAHGFGLYKVTLKDGSGPIGICGLVQRDAVDSPDIGFAFLPKYRSGGYCTEASLAVLQWAKNNKVSHEILAYTKPDNLASIRVLEKIGLQKNTITTLPGQDFESLIMSVHLG